MSRPDPGAPARFGRIATQLETLLLATPDPVAHRATAAALLHHKVPRVSWTGFHILRDGALTVDAYQGPMACLVLEPHVGVCWAAIDRDEPLIVPDVHAFPGHIACDSRTRSELVVPLHGPGGKVIGVLDVDSHEPDRFGPEDLEGYRQVVAVLEQAWHDNPWGAG